MNVRATFFNMHSARFVLSSRPSRHAITMPYKAYFKMACLFGIVQTSLTLLNEAKASVVAIDAFIPRRRYAVPLPPPK